MFFTASGGCMRVPTHLGIRVTRYWNTNKQKCFTCVTLSPTTCFPLSHLLFHSPRSPLLIFLSFTSATPVIFHTHPFVIPSFTLSQPIPFHKASLSFFPSWYFFKCPLNCAFVNWLCCKISPFLFSMSCFLSPSCSCVNSTLQGVGGNDRWGTKHTYPPQWSCASPALCERLDGHLLQRPFDCSLGHGLTHRHQPPSGLGWTQGRCQCGRFWWQIHCVCFWRSHH